MKKSRMILVILMLALVICAGLLTGNITVKNTITKTTKTPQAEQSNDTSKVETLAKESEETVEVEEAASDQEDMIHGGIKAYYPTEEELIKNESNGDYSCEVVHGNNTVFIFYKGKQDDFGVGGFVKEADGYYLYENMEEKQVITKDSVFIVTFLGECYLFVFVEDSMQVEDNLEGDFSVLSMGTGDSAYLRYISCPLEEYELYIDGNNVDLSEGYGMFEEF